LRDEYTRTIEPARALAAEALTLERTLSDLVNQAYALTPAEITLMWQTAPPCTPIPPPGVLWPRAVSLRASVPPFPGLPKLENRQNLPVDILGRRCHSRTMLDETQNQFSLIRAALSTCGRAKERILMCGLQFLTRFQVQMLPWQGMFGPSSGMGIIVSALTDGLARAVVANVPTEPPKANP
jgi:hypothetical protein